VVTVKQINGEKANNLNSGIKPLTLGTDARPSVMDITFSKINQQAIFIHWSKYSNDSVSYNVHIYTTSSSPNTTLTPNTTLSTNETYMSVHNLQRNQTYNVLVEVEEINDVAPMFYIRSQPLTFALQNITRMHPMIQNVTIQKIDDTGVYLSWLPYPNVLTYSISYTQDGDKKTWYTTNTYISIENLKKAKRVTDIVISVTISTDSLSFPITSTPFDVMVQDIIDIYIPSAASALKSVSSTWVILLFLSSFFIGN